MNDVKKPQPPKPQPIREHVDFGEDSSQGKLIKRHQEVSNTRPAPPNPNRDNGNSNQDG